MPVSKCSPGSVILSLHAFSLFCIETWSGLTSNLETRIQCSLQKRRGWHSQRLAEPPGNGSRAVNPQGTGLSKGVTNLGCVCEVQGRLGCTEHDVRALGETQSGFSECSRPIPAKPGCKWAQSQRTGYSAGLL